MTLRPASATVSSASTPRGLARDETRLRLVGRLRRVVRLACPSRGPLARARRRLGSAIGAVRRPVEGGECDLELARAGPLEAALRFDRLAERREVGAIALHQLGLELDEPVNDASAGDHVDFVETQLHARGRGTELPDAAKLADRHALDERCVASVLEDERPRVGRRPIARRRDTVRRPFELLARQGAAGPVDVGKRLDRDDGLATLLAKADREPGACQSTVGECRRSGPPAGWRVGQPRRP